MFNLNERFSFCQNLSALATSDARIEKLQSLFADVLLRILLQLRPLSLRCLVGCNFITLQFFIDLLTSRKCNIE